jgi:hypothetical protein
MRWAAPKTLDLQLTPELSNKNQSSKIPTVARPMSKFFVFVCFAIFDGHISKICRYLK